MSNTSLNINNLISPDILQKIGNQNIKPNLPALNNIGNIVSPDLETKKASEKLNSDLNSAQISMSQEQIQSQKDKATKALKNAAKSLAIALGIPLIDSLIGLVIGNKKLKKLVRETNIIIDAAHTKNTLIQAKIKRDSAYNLLNNQYNKVKNVQNVLSKIEIAISILQIIISILKANPLISKNPAIQSKIDKYQVLIEDLQLILGIIIVCLQHELTILVDLENQLYQLGNVLEDNTQKSPDFQSILDTLGVPNNNSFGTYKGFNFAIKEDNTPGQEVAGYKRHYAVALDKYKVAVLKSDTSFTTDYQVLIDQLKLVIDQQNLQA